VSDEHGEAFSVPDDFSLVVGRVDAAWPLAKASYTIGLPAVGSVRLMYAINEECGPLWSHLVPVEVARREMLARMTWGSGLLTGQVQRSQAGSWWVLARGWGRRAWTRAEAGGLAVVGEMERLIPTSVWARVVRDRCNWVARRDDPESRPGAGGERW
jgi:hypothetical protein